MCDYFKVYNVQFGACSVIRRDLLYYYYPFHLRKWIDYLGLYANFEALVIDGGTVSRRPSLQKSYAMKVANDIYYYGKIDFLISHFHQDHTNFITEIFEEIDRRRKNIDLHPSISIYSNYTPTIYIYSPFNYENELYFSILSLVYKLLYDKKIPEDEFYVLLQFTLTSNLRELIYKKMLKVKLLNDNSTFDINNRKFYVLKKDHSDNFSLFNLMEDINVVELVQSLKDAINNDRNLRYLNIMCHAYDRYFTGIFNYINRENGNDSEAYYAYLGYIGEVQSYLGERDDVEVLKNEIEYLAKTIKLPDNKLIKKIFKSKKFNQHRYNLAFYSKNENFIYFGDNDEKDTKFGLRELLKDQGNVFFYVACANHHGTRGYAKPFIKFSDSVRFGTMFCSNGVGNSNYGKVDYETYSKICNSIYSTNDRIEGDVDDKLCPVYFTNDNSYGMRFY